MKDSHALLHLTGIRAIAAYFVLFGHLINARFYYKGSALLSDYVTVFNFLGMSIFFVLSGFVVTYAYYDMFATSSYISAIRRFFVARFARLYPLYILTLILQFYVVVPAMYYATNSERLSFLTLTQAWFNFQHVTFANAWSISVEWFFYLMFALMAACLSFKKYRNAEARHVAIYAILFAVLFYLALYVLFCFRESVTDLLSAYISHRKNTLVWSWLGYFSPYVRIGEFIIGGLAARMYMLAPKPNASEPPRAVTYVFSGSFLVIAILCVYCMTHMGYDTYLYFLTTNFGFAPFIAFILYASCRYPGRFTALCSHRFIVAGGEISYSLYMMQFVLLLQPVAKLFPSARSFDVTYPDFWWILMGVFFYIVLVTCVATLTYRYVEMPARRSIRKRYGV